MIETLPGTPVLGVSLGGVSVLRLDLAGGAAPGNKAFKLRHNLRRAREQGVRRVLGFGGAWSNHLHALAAVGAELELETIGVVRGAEHPTAMLADAARWGMRLVPVSRENYRQRDDPRYWRELEDQFGPCLVIPEGGANSAGVLGCLDIAGLVAASGVHWDRVVVAVGTGTTLAGLAAGLEDAGELVGISALRGATDLEARTEGLLAAADLCARLPWRIEHGYHCGGFARVDSRLRAFIPAWERETGVPLEPVYTGKAMLAVHTLLASGAWSDAGRTLVIHTGGLQGRRGYPWLADARASG